MSRATIVTTFTDTTSRTKLSDEEYEQFLAMACEVLCINSPDLSKSVVTLSFYDWRRDEDEPIEDRKIEMCLRVETKSPPAGPSPLSVGSTSV